VAAVHVNGDVIVLSNSINRAWAPEVESKAPGVESGEGAVPPPHKIFAFFKYQNGVFNFLCIPGDIY